MSNQERPVHPFSCSLGAVSPTVWRSVPWVLSLAGVRVDIEDAKDGVADARQLTVHWEEHPTLGGHGWACGNAYFAQATYKRNLCVLRVNGVI